MHLGSFLLAAVLAPLVLAETLHILLAERPGAAYLPTTGFGIVCADVAAPGCSRGLARFATARAAVRDAMGDDDGMLTLAVGGVLGLNARFVNLFGARAVGGVLRDVDLFDAVFIAPFDFVSGDAPLLDFMRGAAPLPVLSTTLDVRRLPEMDALVSAGHAVASGIGDVGLVSWYGQDLAFQTRAGGNVSYYNAHAALATEVTRLRASGCRLIVVVAPPRSDDFYPPERLGDMALAVGADLVLSVIPQLTPVFDSVSGKRVSTIVGCAEFSDCSLFAAAVHIAVELDGNGDVVDVSLHPIELTEDVERDATTVALLAPFAASMGTATARPLAFAESDLDGSRNVCRSRDCGVGHVITAALTSWLTETLLPSAEGAHLTLERAPGTDRLPVPVGMMHAGGIRASWPRGNISAADVDEAVPFVNALAVVRLTGGQLLAMFKHAFEAWTVGDDGQVVPTFDGRFLQLSESVRVTWSGDAGVVAVHVQDEDGELVPLNLAQEYLAVMPDYIAGGGDGYAAVQDELHGGGDLLSVVVTRHLGAHSLLVDDGIDRLTMVSRAPSDAASFFTCPFGFQAAMREPSGAVAACAACQPGTYRNATAGDACQLCGFGEFAETPASESCSACPFKHSDTREQGAASLAVCSCHVGYFGNATRADCDACPRGGKCDTGDDQVAPLPGYFRSPEDPLVFRRCIPARSCVPVGQRNGCAEGFTGENCGACVENHFRSRGACVSCSTAHVVLATVGLGVVIVAFAFTFVLGSFDRSYAGLRRRGIVVLVLGALQDLGIVDGYLPDAMPSTFRALVTFAGLYNINLDINGIQCANASFGTLDVFFVTMALPAVFLAVLALIGIGHALVIRFRVRPRLFRALSVGELVDHYMASFLLLLFFAYTGLLEAILGRLDCVEYADGRWFFFHEPDLLCDTDTYWDALPAVVLFAILYGIGIPLALGLLIYRHRYNLTDLRVQRRYGLLLDSFRPRFFWFPAAILVHKCIFVTAKLVLPVSSLFRPLFGCVFVLAFALVKQRLRPMADPLVRRLDVFHFLVAACMVLGTVVSDTPVTAGEERAVGVLVVLLAVPIFAAVGVIVALYLREQITGKAATPPAVVDLMRTTQTAAIFITSPRSKNNASSDDRAFFDAHATFQVDLDDMDIVNGLLRSSAATVSLSVHSPLGRHVVEAVEAHTSAHGSDGGGGLPDAVELKDVRVTPTAAPEPADVDAPCERADESPRPVRRGRRRTGTFSAVLDDDAAAEHGDGPIPWGEV